MKLHLVLRNGQKILCCPNGSILNADDRVLERLLTTFDRPTTFAGTDGCWNETICDMEGVKGRSLAYVDDNMNLIVCSPLAFAHFKTNEEFISASEYAELYQKSHSLIKRLCQEGRIEGAQRNRSGWLIPKSAPYPERKAREVKSKASKA